MFYLTEAIIAFTFSGVQADSHGQLVGAQAEVHGRAAQRDDRFARFSKLLRLVRTQHWPKKKYAPVLNHVFK